VRSTLRRVLGDPERWLNDAFRTWMGPPPDPEWVFATYTAPGGAPPVDTVSTSGRCDGDERAPAPV
jgi:hypothetical protein